MNLDMMISLLNSDLQREVTHWHFYTHSSLVISGLHRLEIREFLQEQAAEEAKHIDEFAHVILGLGGKPSTNNLTLNCPSFEDPKAILEYAYKIETEVVKNYVERITQAQELSDIDPVKAKYIELFLENHVIHSQKDADEILMLVKGL